MIKQIYVGAHIKRDDRGIIETMNNIKNNGEMLYKYSYLIREAIQLQIWKVISR